MTAAARKKPGPKPRTVKTQVVSVIADLSFWQRWSLQRREKKLAKQKARTLSARQTKTLNAKQQRAEAQAQKQAVKAVAVTQVEQAVEKSNKRRSHPFAVLFLLAIVMVLAGTVVWQYRGQQITAKNNEIFRLKQQATAFASQQSAAQAVKQAEAAKYQAITVKGITMRLPVTWHKQPSQFPSDETIFGNDAVSFQIITSSSRNSIDQYIPVVDYLWQVSADTDNSVVVKNQSLQCDRFDTLDNNLSSKVREHNGFHVYCNTDGGKLVVVALAKPDNYGVGPQNVYFIVTINDIQQIRLSDIKGYIESAKLQ
jgi:Na+-transporting methylmalonyl-CoA/oxaloacetate decarboxylase gamma subunit